MFADSGKYFLLTVASHGIANNLPCFIFMMYDINAYYLKPRKKYTFNFEMCEQNLSYFMIVSNRKRTCEA